jgi:(1->4)-alpha-D-glucan 1-alpha-D-glucosylmutase
MGLLLDIVPNHMSTDLENNLWKDVLENGVYSGYAQFFDIDWIAQGESKPKVILPLLAESLCQVLKKGKLRLVSNPDTNRFVCLDVSGTKLPVSAESYPFVLKQLGHVEDFQAKELTKQLQSLDQVPKSVLTSRTKRNLKINRVQSKIVSALSSPKARQQLESTLEFINSKVTTNPDWPEFIDFLRRQHYSLVYWRDAMAKINYRRFCYVNNLIAIRAEDNSVFNESHSLIFDWIKKGRVQALRVDHIDGLRDPRHYLDLLQRRSLEANYRSRNRRSSRASSIYIAVEKILLPGENLPNGWKISGTTGYDFTRQVNGLFILKLNERKFRKIYNDFVGQRRDFERIVKDSKRAIVRRFMKPDVDRLVRLAFRYRLPPSYRHTKSTELRRAIEETISNFPVYRTYATHSGYSRKDHQIVENSLSASRESHAHKKGGYDLLRYLLLNSNSGKKLRHAEFVERFQQLTPTVAAKGIEDTNFYRYAPLSSLNEVGGDQKEFGVTLPSFHARNVGMAKRWPHTLLASSTHDTKWSEDARARLNVLSEVPDMWKASINSCTKINSKFKTILGKKSVPTANDEYLFYQALLAILPNDDISSLNSELIERFVDYMKKASKEEKLETDWIYPGVEYDSALQSFVRSVLNEQNVDFFEAIKPLRSIVSKYGIYNSLSQLLLKLTCPGVPDIYQGCETWNLRMVDPDNRSPVDFNSNLNLLRKMFQKKEESKTLLDFAKHLLANPEDGMIKMYTLASTLRFRSRNPGIFNNGNYVPLYAHGQLESSVVAFAREHKSLRIIVAVSRFLSSSGVQDVPVGSVWNGTVLKLPARFAGEYSNVFTGETSSVERESGSSFLPLSVAFNSLPYCLLFH